MFAILSLPIPSPTVRDLLNFAAETGAPGAAAEFADQAIREWLARAREPHSPKPEAEPVHGYLWKTLFLPEGTQLRVWSRENGSRYAVVVGDRILHAGMPITPNQFVRLQEDIPRNAWMEISLLLPGESAWKAAHVRRSEQQRAERTLRKPPPLPPSPPASTPGSTALSPGLPAPSPGLPALSPGSPALSPGSPGSPALSPNSPAPSPGLSAASAGLQATSAGVPAPLPAPPPAPPDASAVASPIAKTPSRVPASRLSASRTTLGQPQRLPRVPPNASQARIHTAQGPNPGAHGRWWPGGPERRSFARRAEDAFLD